MSAFSFVRLARPASIAAAAFAVVAPAAGAQYRTVTDPAGYGSTAVYEFNGRVDQEIRLQLRDDRAVVQRVGPREVGIGTSSRLLSAIPRQNGQLTLERLAGRGRIDVIQQPTASNGYSAVVRLVDGDAGAAVYHFVAYWQPVGGRSNGGYGTGNGGYDGRNGGSNGGYGRDGYDNGGWGRDGYGRDGYDRNGYDRGGFDRHGYDRNGYDRQGRNRNGAYRPGSSSGRVQPGNNGRGHAYGHDKQRDKRDDRADRRDDDRDRRDDRGDRRDDRDDRRDDRNDKRDEHGRGRP